MTPAARRALVAAFVAAGCGGNLEAAPAERARPGPLHPLEASAGDVLCVTHGAAKLGGRISEPTVRAVALGASGEGAALDWIYQGDTADLRALASGEARRQVGLKLRAQDSCNVIYVMWRLDPEPRLEVSIKRNPGKVTHADCGTSGYTKVKPRDHGEVPILAAGDRHTLRAEIAGDELTAWIDDRVAWRGALPAAARAFSGAPGLRSDNVAFDLVAFLVPTITATGTPTGTTAAPSCRHAADD